MKEVSTIGLDLAKNVFQVHGIDGSGETVVRRQLRRGQVLPFFKKLETAALPGGDGGLCHIALLGARDRGLGA
jgi:transposase